MKRIVFGVVLWAVVTSVAGLSYADGEVTTDAAPEEASLVPFLDYTGDFASRRALTGDWGGPRTTLIEKGIRVDVDLIQTYQGVLDGGTSQNWKYGGSLDIGIDVDTGKAGLWPGGLLHVRAETQFGESIIDDSGSLIGANTDALFPLPNDHQINLSTVVYTQFLTEWFAVLGGKIDTLDGDGNHLASARGKDQFLNPNLVLNPVTLRTSPYSALGGGVLFILPNAWGADKEKGTVQVAILDAMGQPNTSGFDGAFDDGTVMSVEARIPTEFFKMPGSQLVGVTYSTRDFTALDVNDRMLLGVLLGIVPAGAMEREDDSWCAYYNSHQYLYVKPDQERESSGVNPQTKLLQGFGIFARVGAADARTSPIRAFYEIGIGGRGLVPTRPNDTYGAGFFYVDLSNELPDLVLDRFGDSRGAEVFYNIEVTPWVHITPDIQIIDPSLESADTAVVAGVRAKIDF